MTIALDDEMGVEICEFGDSVAIGVLGESDGVTVFDTHWRPPFLISAAGALKLAAYIEAHRAELEEAIADEQRFREAMQERIKMSGEVTT